jgi:hypothetical protein
MPAEVVRQELSCDRTGSSLQMTKTIKGTGIDKPSFTIFDDGKALTAAVSPPRMVERRRCVSIHEYSMRRMNWSSE